jgi:hypothetical protein
MKCASSIEQNAENQDWFLGFSQSKAETHSDSETVRGGVFAALSPIFFRTLLRSCTQGSCRLSRRVPMCIDPRSR